VPTRRIRIAVVYGGRSSEHSISVLSAGSVLAALDPAKYEVVPVGIAPNGQWLLTGATPATMQLEGRTLPSVTGGTSVVLETTGAGLVPVTAGEVAGALHEVDVVFPVLHGRWGEDGTIQGMLELSGVPYVGPGVFASAAGMDKEFSKILLAGAGLDVGSYVVARRGRPFSAVDAQALGLPVFVKPARAGSSVGITRVTDWADLDAALQEAFRHDDKALIEAAVAGREVECGVLENAAGEPEASLPAEIRLRPDSGHDWYDFEAKYLEEAYDLDLPAKLDDEVTARVREAACRAFEAVDCAGLARVDFFVVGDRVIVNEINTMPGFTSTSMYPKMWAATGVEYPELVDRLVAAALRRAGR